MTFRTTRLSSRAAFLALTMGVATAFFPSTADGQQNQQPAMRMPSPTKEEDPGVLMQYFALIVLVGAAVGANLIPSKRGHQD